jgi:2-(1,2-epoxy-1,2-dihydrophenyl)acetyl-CoA isomerase
MLLAAQAECLLELGDLEGACAQCGLAIETCDRVAKAYSVRARALIMMAEKIPACDALQYGLVWKVLADDTLMSEARACAMRLAAMPTRAFDLVKQALAASSSNGLAEQLELEARLQGQAVRTEDHREGVNAFLEKRPPVFKGR